MAKKPEVQYVYYTDGSAARQLEPSYLPLPRRNTAGTHRRQVQQQEVIEIEVLPIVCILVSVLMLASMVFGLQQLRAAYELEDRLETFVLEQEQINLTRRAEYEDNIDLEAVEQKAIALGMIPVEQVQHMNIRVQAPAEVVEDPSFMELVVSFFAGIFA